ncbi:MAG TPA: MopE-related protein, partial [Polyangiales bacterium]|nr:MopE-related protein [Polyangiales bacterium]
MTVSELAAAPATPNASGRAAAVRFGPEGQTFDSPARITLPLPEASSRSASRTNVYVYTPMSARWQRVPMVALDLANGLATARASHFSVYAAIESKLDLALAVAPTADDSACANGIAAQAHVASPLEELELASLNNLPASLRASVPDEASVQDLLAVPGFTGSVRAVQVFELVQRADDSEVVLETQIVATTLYLAPDGSARLTHSDALGNVLGSVSYPQALPKLDEIAERVRGGATAVEFDTLPAEDLAVGARLHLIYFPGDAADEPVNADDLGLAAVERAPRAVIDDSLDDGDCDGVLDAFDGSDDRLVAAVEASPRAVISALAGSEVTLQARVLHGTPSSETWTVIAGDGATLEGVGELRAFKASEADRYLVSYRALVGPLTLEHVFAIDVDQAPADNTPPTCRPTRDADVGRVGDAFPLSAVLFDEETPTSALQVQWGLLDADQLVANAAIREHPGKALFAPLDAGNYVVACRAFDGAVWGPIGSVKVSVVPRGQNRAPSDLTLSPAVSVAKVGDTLKFHASARDADGDPLLFTWYVDGSPRNGKTAGSESELTYSATAAGVVKVSVEVLDTDPNLDPRVSASVRVIVGAEPTTTVDADRDGWNAGTGPAADCNDADASVHPGATDACGDELDSDCDGVIRKEDCDDDGYTVARGDCNDADPKINPGVRELCDGVDNNCEQGVDEGFAVGAACTSGTGACATTGKLSCASDGLSALCSAKPLSPQAELCDGIDNDCDGTLDEGACAVDAGVAPVDAGSTTVDATVGACVPASEKCNQLDDDCNGQIDDIEAKQCNTGLPGACAAGNYGCTANGQACIPQTYGKSETCNQIDDDCNGKVDDGISCMCSPTFGEICGDNLDNDCDGKVDEDCTQTCTPGAQEYCFNAVDDDCDGKIDDQDSDCCVSQGAEDCKDGKDNDCDLYIDDKDTDCAAGVPADNCANPGTIQLGQWKTGYFDGAKPDLASSCLTGRTDLVYAFSVKDEGEYVLTADAPSPFAWSIQQGACDANKVSLNELSCNKPARLQPGNYFLIIEGADKGAFSIYLSQPIPK